MDHEIYTIIDFRITGPYTLWIKFDDEYVQEINILPLLRGEVYGELRDLILLNQVRLDCEAGTLIWPNEADFDPATLHDWERVGLAMIELAQSWHEPVQRPHFHTTPVGDRIPA